MKQLVVVGGGGGNRYSIVWQYFAWQDCIDTGSEHTDILLNHLKSC